jgi:hypothetical protein
MNEGKLRERMDRGEKAAALLRNEILQESFSYLEDQFITAWKESGVSDIENRERIYQLLQALTALRGHIESVVMDGKIAKTSLGGLK